MKQSTLDHIKKLTQNDTKTLSQKGLKTSEEVGELAAAILPYENAHGTTHRFIAKEHILEEVADVFLTSRSIAYQLGFTDLDIDQMIERKMLKWEELQQRHENANFPVPFEIHVTVKNAQREPFVEACKSLEVKPIILDLQMEDRILKDTMTSSKCYGHNSDAYREMKRISQGLTKLGFWVVREKIETVPWHPGAPSNKHGNPVMPQDCYFETHIAVVVTDETLPKVSEIAMSHNAHLSRNAFKTFDDGHRIQMITHRVYEGVYEDFKVEAAKIRADLTEAGFEIENVVTEFSIYDTKVSHDSSWIDGRAE